MYLLINFLSAKRCERGEQDSELCFNQTWEQAFPIAQSEEA